MNDHVSIMNIGEVNVYVRPLEGSLPTSSSSHDDEPILPQPYELMKGTWIASTKVRNILDIPEPIKVCYFALFIIFLKYLRK